LATEQTNFDRLQDEGFAIKTPLPAEYKEIIEGLSPQELDVLIGLKQRVEEAQERTAPEVAPFTEYVWGPIF
jgi:hypothetical protein